MTYDNLASEYKTLSQVIHDFPFYKSVKTLKRALDRKGIPTEKRGKTVVIKKDDVCIFFGGETSNKEIPVKNHHSSPKRQVNNLVNPAIAKKLNNQLYERKL